MATFTISTDLKNKMLNKAFREDPGLDGGNPPKIWVAVKTSSGGFEAQEMEFTYPINAITQNSSVINFLVDEGVIIDEIRFGGTKARAESSNHSLHIAYITLTGSDIVEFEEIGAYVIAELKIQLI